MPEANVAELKKESAGLPTSKEGQSVGIFDDNDDQGKCVRSA
jgi:hypothetical protein